MKDLDLASLRMFAAVCEHRNIARAAEQEHVVPSAISKRVAQLESGLGVTLLQRNRRGVEPTPAGLALIERARTILFEAARIGNDMAAFSGGVRGHVSLLATPSAIAESLLDDVASFMREPTHRDIKIDIEERFTRDVVRTLQEGSSAIGICWDNADLEGLHHRPYRQDDLSLAVHPEHPLAGRSRVRFEQTLDYDHVGLQPSSAVQITLQRAAARAGRSINYRVIVSNFDAAFRVVAAGLAISVIPVQVSSPYVAQAGLRIIPLTDPWARRRFAICYRDEQSLQGARGALVDHLAAQADTAS